MRPAILAFLLLCTTPLQAEIVHIAVAANFKAAAERINTQFEAHTGHSTLLSSASTGALHSQILYGAPFDIFFSADEKSPHMLEEEGLGVPGQQFCYALGILVLVGSQTPEADLRNPQLSLAIANPNTAPYGKAAWEVLQKLQFKPAVSRKLVRANNAIQAYQHWHSSAVDLALVPRSLTPEEGATIPPNWYTPIEQHVILLQRGAENPAAQAYIRWLRSEEVQTSIKKSGYGNCQ